MAGRYARRGDRFSENRDDVAHVRSGMTVSGGFEPPSHPAPDSASDTAMDTASETASNTESNTESNRVAIQVAMAALAGGAVAVALGTYGRVHDPTFRPIRTSGSRRCST